MKTSLFLTTAIAGLLFTGVAAAADPITYVVQELSGDNELPDKVNSANTGTVVLTFYPDKKQLCGHISFTPSTFAYTAAHVHEGSETTPNGTNYITRAGDKGAGEIKVNVTDLTADQITKLTTGESYVNVHSEAHTGGEMRGQLLKDDTVADEVCDDTGTGTGGEDAGASSSGATGDAGKTTSSSSGSVTPASTDDGGGCNTTGSSGGNALALLAGLGVVVAAASRKRKKA